MALQGQDDLDATSYELQSSQPGRKVLRNFCFAESTLIENRMKTLSLIVPVDVPAVIVQKLRTTSAGIAAHRAV